MIFISVYPTIPEGIRDINQLMWNKVETFFNERNNEELVKTLLSFDLFPIKDSYVAYLKRDKNAILRNPRTVNRLAGRMYELGLNKLYEKCTEPKETNRQVGPLFKRWINQGALGIRILKLQDFEMTQEDAILDATDAEMMDWAKRTINYNRLKGLVLDFFCGSGTTLVACEELGRKLIGIDKSAKALDVVKKRMFDITGLYSKPIEIIGV